ncbi:hypothetical protein SteCoe_23818 [Stentor coeruleus]|uniref:Uncharacterized protein n=1 Tax=Stentor coeruleus TaxID=5963 RepID=A0A1R2BJ10_9CILI|nr:hypothetical protein SteCoe_23818 [Stentor coeruleus]
MDKPRTNKRVYTSEKVDRKLLRAKLVEIEAKGKQFVIKKRASKIVLPLENWVITGSTTQAAEIDNSKKHKKNLSWTVKDKEKADKIESKMNEHLKSFKNMTNDDKKLRSEYAYFLEMLRKMCELVKPYDKILEKIVDGLGKYGTMINMKPSDDCRDANEKLMQKLKVLSAENIEFYKKNEDLKKELSLVRKTVVYNETHFAIENLLKELSVKSDYISRSNKEINEYKARELHLLKLLGNRGMMSPDIVIDIGKRSDEFCKRSQSIKSIPLICFKADNVMDKKK